MATVNRTQHLFNEEYELHWEVLDGVHKVTLRKFSQVEDELVLSHEDVVDGLTIHTEE